MASLDPAHAAHDLLLDGEVISRLALDPAEASRLGLALVTDADLAPELAADLLAKGVARIDEIKRQESYATAVPAYDCGEMILYYQLSEGTRRCLQLLEALRVIAAARDQAAGRAA